MQNLCYRQQLTLLLLMFFTLAGLFIVGCSPLEGVIPNQEKEDTMDSYGNASIPPIDQETPGKIETATFALGWFWGPDAQFGQLDGVVRTRVGYAGGRKDNPTYYNLGDHTETLEIDFDPKHISYAELLTIFWNSHSPMVKSWSKQYMAIVFYHSQEQEALARETKTRLEEEFNDQVFTEIRPFTKFYLAEDYHQKYYLQNDPELMRELQFYADNFQGFVDSTAAARINGYIAGYGSADNLASELNALGLSPAGKKKLTSLVR